MSTFSEAGIQPQNSEQTQNKPRFGGKFADAIKRRMSKGERPMDAIINATEEPTEPTAPPTPQPPLEISPLSPEDLQDRMNNSGYLSREDVSIRKEPVLTKDQQVRGEIARIQHESVGIDPKVLEQMDEATRNEAIKKAKNEDTYVKRKEIRSDLSDDVKEEIEKRFANGTPRDAFDEDEWRNSKKGKTTPPTPRTETPQETEAQKRDKFWQKVRELNEEQAEGITKITMKRNLYPDLSWAEFEEKYEQDKAMKNAIKDKKPLNFDVKAESDKISDLMKQAQGETSEWKKFKENEAKKQEFIKNPPDDAEPNEDFYAHAARKQFEANPPENWIPGEPRTEYFLRGGPEELLQLKQKAEEDKKKAEDAARINPFASKNPKSVDEVREGITAQRKTQEEERQAEKKRKEAEENAKAQEWEENKRPPSPNPFANKNPISVEELREKIAGQKKAKEEVKNLLHQEELQDEERKKAEREKIISQRPPSVNPFASKNPLSAPKIFTDEDKERARLADINNRGEFKRQKSSGNKRTLLRWVDQNEDDTSTPNQPDPTPDNPAVTPEEAKKSTRDRLKGLLGRFKKGSNDEELKTKDEAEKTEATEEFKIGGPDWEKRISEEQKKPREASSWPSKWGVKNDEIAPVAPQEPLTEDDALPTWFSLRRKEPPETVTPIDSTNLKPEDISGDKLLKSQDEQKGDKSTDEIYENLTVPELNSAETELRMKNYELYDSDTVALIEKIGRIKFNKNIEPVKAYIDIIQKEGITQETVDSLRKLDIFTSIDIPPYALIQTLQNRKPREATIREKTKKELEVELEKLDTQPNSDINELIKSDIKDTLLERDIDAAKNLLSQFKRGWNKDKFPMADIVFKLTGSVPEELTPEIFEETLQKIADTPPPPLRFSRRSFTI